MNLKTMFIKLLIKWVLLSVIIFYTAEFISGINFDGVWAIIMAAGLIALINIFIKPILKIITFPINMMSMGLFTIVLNALLLWGVSYLVPGFNIDYTIQGFFNACLASIVISVLSVVLNFV